MWDSIGNVVGLRREWYYIDFLDFPTGKLLGMSWDWYGNEFIVEKNAEIFSGTKVGMIWD